MWLRVRWYSKWIYVASKAASKITNTECQGVEKKNCIVFHSILDEHGVIPWEGVISLGMDYMIVLVIISYFSIFEEFPNLRLHAYREENRDAKISKDVDQTIKFN